MLIEFSPLNIIQIISLFFSILTLVVILVDQHIEDDYKTRRRKKRQELKKFKQKQRDDSNT